LTANPPQLEYRLLAEFRRLFEGKLYKHRASNQGDFVAMHLYEDLVTISRSPKLIDAAINRMDRVLNVQNRRRGVAARSGDGTFGEIIPGELPITDPGYLVARGPIATVEIGVEVKVLAKAMIKQIDRVINDLPGSPHQWLRHFRNQSLSSAVAVGIRSALRSWGSIARITPWDTKATGHFQPLARPGSCIPVKRHPRPNGVCVRMPLANSMSSSY